MDLVFRHSSNKIDVLIIPVLTDNYSYLLHCKESGMTAVIDPGEAKPILHALHELGWVLKDVFCTHHHADHIAGIEQLKSTLPLTVWGPHTISEVTKPVQAHETLQWAGHPMKIMSLPGHTLDHIAYHIPDEKLLFCGDVLFSMGCGRIFEGSPEMMWNSLQKVRSLPQDTWIFCGHEYTETNARFALEIDENNPELKNKWIWIQKQKKRKHPTLPCLLKEEQLINPFLRVENKEIQKNISLPTTATPLQVFTRLRTIRNTFK